MTERALRQRGRRVDPLEDREREGACQDRVTDPPVSPAPQSCRAGRLARRSDWCKSRACVTIRQARRSREAGMKASSEQRLLGAASGARGDRNRGWLPPASAQEQEAQHPGHLGRRHRLVQHQRLQPRRDGLPDAEHRPDRARGRAVHRLVRAAELHRRAGGVHHRPVAGAHRPDQGRAAGRRSRPQGGGPDHRRAAQEPRLHDRPVRQEPPRRSRRAHADQPRLRRVLRQPVPPERRGGAGESRLPAGPDLQGEVRPARRDQVDRQSGRRRRRSRTPAR